MRTAYMPRQASRSAFAVPRQARVDATLFIADGGALTLQRAVVTAVQFPAAVTQARTDVLRGQRMAAVTDQHAAGRHLHADAHRRRPVACAFTDRRTDRRAEARAWTGMDRAVVPVREPHAGPQRDPARIALVAVAGVAATVVAHALVQRLWRLDVDVA